MPRKRKILGIMSDAFDDPGPVEFGVELRAVDRFAFESKGFIGNFLTRCEQNGPGGVAWLRCLHGRSAPESADPEG
jgi:hypothetical protein